MTGPLLSWDNSLFQEEEQCGAPEHSSTQASQVHALVMDLVTSRGRAVKGPNLSLIMG